MKLSVIMPVERLGDSAERAIASVLEQQAPFPFELLIVTAAPVTPSTSTRVRNVVEPNRNPATRRNRAASAATGEILAFIDDDAEAASGWLATAVAYLDAHSDVLAIGGPDPAPRDSTIAELLSDTLLATPHIGSGIACHEDRRGVFAVRKPSDVALVNLFIRRDAFSGFDESIGYIGEDTALVASLMPHVVYHDGVRVFHRRRAFPAAYLRQRWRYRVKTGQMLAKGVETYSRNRAIQAFMIAGTMAILLLPIAILPYVLLTLILGARATRLPIRCWPLIPFAFAAHHATYYFGIAYGYLRTRLRRHGA